MQLQANSAQVHGEVHSAEGYSSSPSLQVAAAACSVQHDVTCTELRAHIEDQNVDPAASQRALVRGELSGYSLSEQFIRGTIENPGERRAIWMQFGYVTHQQHQRKSWSEASSLEAT